MVPKQHLKNNFDVIIGQSKPTQDLRWNKVIISLCLSILLAILNELFRVHSIVYCKPTSDEIFA